MLDKKGGNPLCDFGNILKDVVKVVNGLNFYDVSHVLREGNVHVHVLEKIGISCKSFARWKGVVPVCVSEMGCSLCVSQTICPDLPIRSLNFL